MMYILQKSQLLFVYFFVKECWLMTNDGKTHKIHAHLYRLNTAVCLSLSMKRPLYYIT